MPRIIVLACLLASCGGGTDNPSNAPLVTTVQITPVTQNANPQTPPPEPKQ